MPNYSKAPRGLFVLVEVGRVFTAIAISPSKGLRQLLARDAIRAGRNLPDKGFRYRRTLIVKAAVYRSLTLLQPAKREQRRLTYRHWAGVSPYTSSYEFARTCVFDKQPANRHLLRSPCGDRTSCELTSSLFAEFLKPLSLAHLSILYQPTCVGLRYGLL
jgi:hypothetical protein